MKHYTRLLAWLLALTMLCSAFTACGTPGNGEASDTTSAPATETTAPVEEAPVELKIVVDGKAQYDIIRSEDVGTGSPEVIHARSIVDAIKATTGAMATIGTDWTKKGRELDSSTFEILLGNTDYPETRQVQSTLSYGEWAIRVVGNKIVIFGYDVSALGAAVATFTRVLRRNVSEDGKNIILTSKDIEASGTQNRQLEALPVFDGGTFYSYYAAGNKCDEIIIRDTNVEQYNTYLGKLESAGFVKYTDHEIANNLFATYNSDKYTVNVGYYDYETSVRVLIEPLAPAVGLKEDNVYTTVTTPQLTMLGQQYIQDNGSPMSNGLSVVIRCADGRFIIVDGGFNRADTASELVKTLREQSSAYAKSDSEITIAAWIITHAHGDHNGVLNGRYASFKNMNVERVLVNFLSETERLKSVNSSEYSKNWSTNEGTYEKTITAAKELGAEVHWVHVGQVYYIADVTMEILFTIESFAPQTCNALNGSSTVMMMNIAGTTYLSTGDATGNGMEICADMFGDYIQSDIVQVCHHGGSTWGNNTGMIKAYQIINAPTVLTPRGVEYYNTKLRNVDYNAVLYTTSNYKEEYISGSVGDAIILPMPYTIGTGKVIRAQ